MNARNLPSTVLAALSLMWLPLFPVAAHAAPGYTITKTVVPAGSGTITLDPVKATYAKNNIVVITAVPAPGTPWVFDHWSGSLSGTQPQVTVRIGSNVNATANFRDSSIGGGSGPPPLPASRLVVGYFAQWDIYQRNYLIRNVETSGAAERLNVMNYAFAAPDASLHCVSLDTFADYGKAFSSSESVDGVADTSSQPLKGNFNQILKLKARHPQLRVLLSLGGWTESTYFSAAARDANRAAFVTSCIDTFMRGNVAGVFDGFDIDWEYPGSAGATNNFSAEDAANFPALLEEFRAQLEALESEVEARTGARPEYLVTAAIPAGQAHYNPLTSDAVTRMGQAVDWVNVMAYDIHGPFEATGPANHAAPLFKSPCDLSSADWGDKAIQYYLASGVPQQKLLLGVPFYGHGWRGVAAVGNGLCQPATGLARGTYEKGTNDYKVIIAQGRTESFDAAAVGDSTFNGSEFWSFDDTDALAAKAKYVNGTRQLRGMMFWELSGDTTDGRLVKAMRASLDSP